MKDALRILSELQGDSSIASRDPASSLSFCILDQQTVNDHATAIATYAKGVSKAFRPTGEDGRPYRKCVDSILARSISDVYSLIPISTDFHSGKTTIGSMGTKMGSHTLVGLDRVDPFFFFL